MPPRAKYSRQEIMEKAIGLIKREGADKLTARELAAELGTSSKPVFIAFENMDELKKAVFDSALGLYVAFQENFYEPNPFKKCGKTYITFAIKEPNLFQFIFMKPREKTVSLSEYMHKLDSNYEETVKMISRTCGVSIEKADTLYKNMWIFSHGIATLCASGQCILSEEEIEALLSCTYDMLTARV